MTKTRLTGKAYEKATGKCARCSGEGRVRGGHATCSKCAGSGKAAGAFEVYDAYELRADGEGDSPVAWNVVCEDMECQRVPNRCDHVTEGYLLRCAEGEGGRAVLAVQGYGNANTAAYFAREAAHYGRLLLDARGQW
jgi:RecJ-like exonuclease